MSILDRYDRCHSDTHQPCGKISCATKPSIPISVHNNSRSVVSSQTAVHPKLAGVVARHLNATHRAPPRTHNLAAFEILREAAKEHALPLILDSFCGTGHSTAALAERHPRHLIIGIDQSQARLARHPQASSTNYLLLQANCEAIWALMVNEGLTVDAHYLLYPNPWPKPSQLQRRIHGHPGFADLIRLGGRVELRSNWQLYVEEFGIAMQLAGAHGLVGRVEEQAIGISLFEQKYHGSGQALWAYRGVIS